MPIIRQLLAIREEIGYILEGNILFKSFPSEIQQVNIGDIRNTHRWQVQSDVLSTTKFELVYALSSFGNMFNTNFLNILYLTYVQTRTL